MRESYTEWQQTRKYTDIDITLSSWTCELSLKYWLARTSFGYEETQCANVNSDRSYITSTTKQRAEKYFPW